MRIATLLVTGLLALSFGAHAQTAAPARAQPPQVWIDPALGKLDAIALQDLSIDIRVEGFIASTTLDMTFYNPNARVLEGELVFPLAEGQSITGYALEVGGKLRQGVVVEKGTARVAYEATTRRNIDPGLAELTRGNVFRTRLYPIPARGTKRVAISFDQPLTDLGAAYRYLLPLQLAQKIGHFKVHAEAIRVEHAPKAGAAGAALTFDRAHDSFVADLERSDFLPEREFAFTIDKPAATAGAFTVQDRLEPAWRMFAAQVQAAAPADAAGAAAVRRIALFYDASGSARERNRARELDFLAAWLAKLRDVDVDLIAFRNDADPVSHFAIHDGDGSALRKALEALPLDGGTSYGAIRLDGLARPDVALVLGDGISNFAERVPHLAFADGTVPRVVFAHAAQSVDSANLARWARQFGGRVINLLGSDDTAAIAQAGAAPWLLQKVAVTNGECTDLAPAAPAPANASFSLYGRCKGAAQLDLQFGNGTGAMLHRQLRLDDGTALDPQRGAFVARLWAVARIADLENAAQPDEKAITELGKRFGVVTSNTSMLVLDRIEDYVRYRVEPREPELLAQYQSLIGAQPKSGSDADGKRQAMLATVLGWWTEFKQYHETRHPWLETVLAPAADAEVARWRGVGGDKDAAAHARAAQRIAERAAGLHKRWLKDGSDAQTRSAWEKEATALMLELDGLRQQRLALAPDSDTIKPEAQLAVAGRRDEAVAYSTTTRAAPRPVASPAMAAPAPPAPMADGAPAQPAREVAMAPMMMEADKTVGPADRKQLIAGEDKPVEQRTHATIQLQEWDPNTPTLAMLRAAKDPYDAYLQARERFAGSPSFYLDSADYFRNEAKNARLALRVLSNIAEIDTASAPLLRILAYRLEQWERFELAVPLFEDALKLRGEEPQSYRDLALALARQPRGDYARSAEMLWKVVASEWDSRFPEIQLIALHELNDVLARAPQAERAHLVDTFIAQGGDARLFGAMPVDLRVVLTWDADNTDMDLWVIDPTGDVAIYSQPRTKTGGRMSRDFTGGYGPEVFTITRPLPGTYTVKANYYGSRAQKLTGDVTVQAEFFTRFDSGEDHREAVTRRLADRKDLIEIGRFTVTPN